MDVRPSRSEADYDRALAEVERYFGEEPAPGTPEADRFDVLSALIAAYEDRHWPIEAADPVATLLAVMEARGYGQADLAAVLGSRSRASEVLNRRRELSKDGVWRIHRAWGVPADLLIAPCAPRRTAPTRRVPGSGRRAPHPEGNRLRQGGAGSIHPATGGGSATRSRCAVVPAC